MLKRILEFSISVRFSPHSYLFVFFIVLLSLNTSANEAICKIKIDDLVTGSSYMIEESIPFTEGKTKHKKTFNIPLNQYTCALIFYDMNTGTSLSCESKKESEKFFVLSDRSGQKETPVANKLSFKTADSSVSLNAYCVNRN